MDVSVAIDLRDPSKRSGFRNAKTAYYGVEQLRSGRITLHQRLAPECEVAFITSFAHIRQVCSGAPRDAMAVFAMDRSGVAGHAIVRSRAGGIQTAILGRHSRTDLFLPDDPHLSLRHLGLVLHPKPQGALMQWQLLDLRTGLQFCDERGEVLEHIASNGPVFIQAGQHALLFLPLDREYPWSSGALSCWAALPPRTYEASERVRQRRFQHSRAVGDTNVQTLPGARFPTHLGGDTPLGELRVTSGRGTVHLPVSERSLASGVLLGRYDRCDNRVGVLDDENVSRVHAFVLGVGDQIWIVDGASTNGIWIAGQRVRQARLRPGLVVDLGRRVAKVVFEKR